ncbi:MAG: hypothetical protein OEY49_16290 [Candidatus Heimdallarchaeota archaeon]|nr:hypothetical protein [Candidatus Heimdallarchaeota archaeon]
MDQQLQEKKKKKGLAKKLSEKIGRDSEPDTLVVDTLGELKQIVGSMKDVFGQFETGYSEQLEEERTRWEKVQSKLPGFMQNKSTKVEEHRLNRIKSNKGNLAELEDNLSKLELLLSTSNSSLETIGETYLKTAATGKEVDNSTLIELEKKMEKMQENMSDAMNDMNAQIRLIKTALDNMAGQLDEQGLILEDIDDKIDVIDTKMDKAQDMLKKISNKITGNRLIMLAVIGTATALMVTKFLAPA